jgi:hypothetical protein
MGKTERQIITVFYTYLSLAAFFLVCYHISFSFFFSLYLMTPGVNVYMTNKYTYFVFEKLNI